MVVPNSPFLCLEKRFLFALCLLMIPAVEGSHSCYYSSSSGTVTCNIHESKGDIDERYKGVVIGATVFGVIFFIMCIVCTVYLIKRKNRTQHQIGTSQGNQPQAHSLPSNTFLTQTNPTNGASTNEQLKGINNGPSHSAPVSTTYPSSSAILQY